MSAPVAPAAEPKPLRVLLWEYEDAAILFERSLHESPEKGSSARLVAARRAVFDALKARGVEVER
jgi:hypothetical protein